MSFLRRLFGSSPATSDEPSARPTRPDDIEDRRTPPPTDGFEFAGSYGRIHAVGESQYRAALVRATGGPAPAGVSVLFTVELAHEPANRFDPNAVSVRLQDEVIGYLPRIEAAAYRPVFDRLHELSLNGFCEAFVGWGWDRGPSDRGDFSIVVHIDPPAEQLRLLEYVPVGEREYASTVCPYCRTALQPLRKAKAACRTCAQPVYVRSAPDNRRYLLRGEDLPMMEMAWAAHHAGDEAEVGHYLASLVESPDLGSRDIPQP